MDPQHPQSPQSSPRYVEHSSWPHPTWKKNSISNESRPAQQDATSSAWTKTLAAGWSFGIACSAPSRKSCQMNPSSTVWSIKSNPTIHCTYRYNKSFTPSPPLTKRLNDCSLIAWRSTTTRKCTKSGSRWTAGRTNYIRSSKDLAGDLEVHGPASWRKYPT